MASAIVDVGYLATHLGVPEANLVTVTTDPTAELVKAVLAAVAAKGHEYETLYSQKVHLEVELETNVRGAEAQRDASSETAKKALKDLDEIRQKLTHEETTRQALENEIQSIKSSNSTSQSDIETLRARIASLETSNREALGIIDTKNSANDTLSQELQTQHQKNLKLNQELTSAQQQVQNANNAVNTARYKEQSLRQELEMAQRSAEFWENESKTKSAEALKVRREKGARVTQLERENDELRSDRDSKDKLNQQHKKRIEDEQARVEQLGREKQQAEDNAARKVEGLIQDLDSTKRLVTMKDEQNISQKNRLAEMETRIEQVNRNGEDAVRRISEELEQTRQAHDEAATEVENLQVEVGRLEAMLAGPRASPIQPGSAPQTPRPMNGSLLGRPGSPFATPASTRKSVSATQALDEMYKVKGLLAVEKQRTTTLAKELDEMMDQLEAKGPEVEELQSENERLQLEIQNMSHLSDESFKERDIAKKAARKAEADSKTAQTETNILRNQLRDLSAQMQMMMFNMEHQGQELTMEETLQLQRIERASGFTNDEMSDVDQLVTERLVVFRNIKDLQEKNQELLRVIHELSNDMRNAEDAAAKQQAADDHNEVIHLREKLNQFGDKFRSFKLQSETIVKERDMFRRLLSDKPSNTAGSAIDGGNGVLASIEPEGGSIINVEGSDYATALRELQLNFDTYCTETTVNNNTMREQIDGLASEKNTLLADKTRLSSQLSLQEQRYEMLGSNFAASQSENKELQKRLRENSDTISKLDIRTSQAAEDLVTARSQVDGLRNENANLKAEKNMWKDIKDRLSQDNERLNQDKTRLNELLATQQSLQNERELSDGETKRRLQGQVETLETELNTTKRKLADEVEEGKKLQLRKEFDAQQAQKRIDELTTNLGQIREELVAAKTSRDHLQARVDELSIGLRSAEERAERLQPRPTPRPGSLAAAGDENGPQDTDERIQDLIHEVSDLKRDLDLANTHLENTKAQAEQYRELSQANEEELQGLHAAQDQYVQEMDALLASKDATIKELEQRVEDLSTELGRSNGELSTLRDSQAEVARRFEDEKAIMDEEIKRLKQQEEDYTTSGKFHAEDLRVQADIASNAQQAYESEVTKHGETAKSLTSVRDEYRQLRTAAATLRAEAESAKATLLQNESSWDERRKKLEQELSDLRTRRDDADKQNKLLHQQLESVTAQVTAIQQSRAAANESLDTIAAQPSSTSEDGLREISNYLRREKDILEVQFDLKVREAKRLQENLDYTRSQLDETRLKLEQERQSQSNSERNSMSHKELMAKLEQLNLFRESNAALRAESRQTQAQLVEKTTRVTELEDKVQPLEAQIEELNSQIGHKEAEIKQIHEDRDRWQKRTEDILSKHGRTDPAEVEELKQTVATLQTERDTLQEAEQPLKEKIKELEQALQEKETGWQASREKLVAQFKERSRNLSKEKNEAIAEKDRLQGELNETHTQLTSTREELESEKKERLVAQESINNFQRQVQTLQDEAQQLKNSSAPAPAPPPTPAPAAADTPDEQVANLEKQLIEAKAELENISSQKATVDHELENLRGQLNTMTTERDQALANAQSSAENGDVAMDNGTGAALSLAAASSATLSDEERKALEQRITEAEAKATEFETKTKELEDNQTAIVASRSEKMKAALNNKLKERNTQIEKERTEMKESMEKQQSDFDLRMQQERKIWEVEHKSATTESKPPGTPSQPPALVSSTATPPAPSTNFENISDAEARKFISTNQTVKGIITANVKSKVTEAIKKITEDCEQNHTPKSEVEQKVAQAREQAGKLAVSKSTLQLNLADNKFKAANAKLGVVESAAKDTPERPVGEVWEIAKVAKPPLAQPKQPAPASATNTAVPPNPTAVPAQPASTGNGAASQVPKPATVSNLPKPQASIPTAGGAMTATPSANPFASPEQVQTAPTTGNPFTAANTSGVQSNQAQDLQPAPAGQAPAPPKSNIPAPGGALKSGPRQHSGSFQGGRGGQRGGRGGNRGGARTSLNPSANNFELGTGNKRPRNDSEIGAGGGAKKLKPSGQ